MLITLLAACATEAPPPLRHTAFVWQQQWTPAVTASIQSHGPALDGLLILRAELGWRDGQPDRRVISWGEAAALPPERVAMAIRVLPLDQIAPPQAAAALAELVAELLAETPDVSEVHIDFDARSDALSSYAEMLRTIRPLLGQRRLTITALPDWLGRDGFDVLCEVVDGYVLQVHWLAPPADIDAPLSLMSVEDTRRWVAAAGALGEPFRVALPTYGYQVAYDPLSGAAIGIHAEQGRAGGTARWREVRAEPAEIAPLIEAWSRQRPAAMRGVSWYRLPVEGDTLNWSWPTLAAVMAGVVPEAGLAITFSADGTGLVDVRVENTGAAGAGVGAIGLRWPADVSLLAADGLGGMRWEGEQLVAQQPVWVAPGAALPVGWLRLSAPAPVEATITLRERR